MLTLLNYLVLFLLAACGLNATADDGVPVIFDAHIHYDQDIWNALPPARAIHLLTQQNIQRALVSATPTEGAEKLYRENPDIVVPMLRPYKSWRHRYLWYKDPELKSYLLQHLQRVPYRGFGEFHVFGENMNTRQIEDMIALARERQLVLHPHTDLAGIEMLLKKSKGIAVIWAHGGFDVPLEILTQLLDEYPDLSIDLSLRDGLPNEDGMLTDQWRTLLVNYRSRFLLGADTYKPSRWAELPEIVEQTRAWLSQLPEEVAADLERNNFERLFPR